MSHPNAEKGKRWERWCASFLGIKRKGKLGDHNDMGDLDDPDFIYECKDDASRSPMQWWKQAEAAQLRSGLPWAVVLSKVRNPKPVEPRGWATMSIEQWRVLREYIRWLESFRGPEYRTRALRQIREVQPSEVLTDGLADDPLPFSLRQAPERPSQSL